MKSSLLKLTSVLSVAAFMAVTLFSTPAQAELVSANDVVVDATYEVSSSLSADKYIFIYKCFVLGCNIDTK